MNCTNLVFSGSALQKMFCDEINCREVQATVALGEVIEESFLDFFSTALILTPRNLLNVSRRQLLQVRCIYDAESGTGYVMDAELPYAKP